MRKVTAISIGAEPGTVFAAASAAIPTTGAKIVQELPERGWIKASNAMTFWSWGEVIEVTVEPTGSGSKVTVLSKSRVPITLVDWGKNSRNVQRVIAAIVDQLPHAAAAPA